MTNQWVLLGPALMGLLLLCVAACAPMREIRAGE
jgi:hypothetical protein